VRRPRSRCRRGAPEIDEARWRQATRVVVAANVAATLEARAAALGRTLAASDVERMTWDRVTDARTFSATDYAASIRVMHAVGRMGRPLHAALRHHPHPDDVRAAPATRRSGHDDDRRQRLHQCGLREHRVYVAVQLVGESRDVGSAGVVARAAAGRAVCWAVRGEGVVFRLAAQLEAARPWSARAASVQNWGNESESRLRLKHEGCSTRCDYSSYVSSRSHRQR